MPLLVGFLLLAIGVASDLPRWPGRAAQLPWLSCSVAAAVFALAGALALAGRSSTVGLGSFAELGTARLTVDRLSGLFLLLSCAIAVPVLLASAGLVASQARPRLAASSALCLGGVVVVITSDHVFPFLFGWEGVTLAFYLLSGHDRRRSGRPRAAMAAALFGKMSGALLVLGFTLVAERGSSLAFSDLAGAHTGWRSAVGYPLLLLGFGIKVGWLPVQVWLPPAYAAAPGPARPVMAAVAVNVGFYGMWRTLDLLGPAPTWLVVLILLVAGATALFGIAHAAVHPDLNHLIAWSSVENAGLITAGFAAALVGAAAHNQQLVALGLLAGCLQVVAHSLGKATLFLAAASLEQELGTTDLDRLRGAARRLPWTGVGLVVGSWTLAGLPLAAGFASEWFVLESLMQQFRVESMAMRLATATAGALIALTVGVAGVTFVRLLALTAFGTPASPEQVRQRPDRQPLLRLGICLLVAACIGVSVLAPLEVRLIASGLEPLTGGADRAALASPGVLQPVFPGFSSLSPSWLSLVLPVMAAVIAGVAWVLSRGRAFRVRTVEPWTSGSTGAGRQTQYTSFAYANPMRKVLANLLRTRAELRGDRLPVSATGTPLPQLGPGRSTTVPPARGVRRRGPQLPADLGEADETASDVAPLGYQVDVTEVIERYLYRPLAAALLWVVRRAKLLQSGRLDAYMAYMLVAVVAVLAVVAAAT